MEKERCDEVGEKGEEVEEAIKGAGDKWAGEIMEIRSEDKVEVDEKRGGNFETGNAEDE